MVSRKSKPTRSKTLTSTKGTKSKLKSSAQPPSTKKRASGPSKVAQAKKKFAAASLDRLIAKFVDADTSHAELVDILTSNGIPRDAAVRVADDMRPVKDKKSAMPAKPRTKLQEVNPLGKIEDALNTIPCVKCGKILVTVGPSRKWDEDALCDKCKPLSVAEQVAKHVIDPKAAALIHDAERRFSYVSFDRPDDSIVPDNARCRPIVSVAAKKLKNPVWTITKAEVPVSQSKPQENAADKKAKREAEKQRKADVIKRDKELQIAQLEAEKEMLQKQEAKQAKKNGKAKSEETEELATKCTKPPKKHPEYGDAVTYHPAKREDHYIVRIDGIKIGTIYCTQLTQSLGKIHDKLQRKARVYVWKTGAKTAHDYYTDYEAATEALMDTVE